MKDSKQQIINTQQQNASFQQIQTLSNQTNRQNTNNNHIQKKKKTYLILCLIIFLLGIILILIHSSLHSDLFYHFSQIRKPSSKEFDSIQTSLSIDDKNKAITLKKRNLSVWTKNCCPTTQSCGIFFEDCCQIDQRGCNWYIFCYAIADDKDCDRVKTIVQTVDGYWAI